MNQNSIKKAKKSKVYNFSQQRSALFFCGPTFSTVSSTLLYWSSQLSSFNVLIGRFKILAFLDNSTLPCSKPSPLLSLLLVLPKPIAQTDAAGTELVPMAMAWKTNAHASLTLTTVNLLQCGRAQTAHFVSFDYLLKTQPYNCRRTHKIWTHNTSNGERNVLESTAEGTACACAWYRLMWFV